MGQSDWGAPLVLLPRDTSCTIDKADAAVTNVSGGLMYSFMSSRSMSQAGEFNWLSQVTCPHPTNQDQDHLASHQDSHNDVSSIEKVMGCQMRKTNIHTYILHKQTNLNTREIVSIQFTIYSQTSTISGIR